VLTFGLGAPAPFVVGNRQRDGGTARRQAQKPLVEAVADITAQPKLEPRRFGGGALL